MTPQTARLSYDHDKHFFKIDCLPAEKAMVYGMFSRVIDAFLEEQVGPTVQASRHPNALNYDLDLYMANWQPAVEREHSGHKDRTNSLWSEDRDQGGCG